VDFDELQRITVTTAFPVGGDTAGVQQVKVVHEFTPDYVTPPVPFDSATTLTSTTLVVAPASPQDVGVNITFTATVAPAVATGTMMFFDSGAVIGSAPVSSGSATFVISMLTAGTHSITARYNGDATYGQSTSPIVPYTIN
jgi:hypothetical protein